jgi:Holliday junction resolvase RusA-like endonuclease
MLYKLKIKPKPTPRPRVGRYGAYYTKSYQNHKDLMHHLTASLNIPRKDYTHLSVSFNFPYPKGKKKSDCIDNVFCRTKGDLDNLLKCVMDALEQTKVIENDNQFCKVQAEKRWTTDELGYILFSFKEF